MIAQMDKHLYPVAIVCSDVSDNCLGRALLLADIVSREHTVKIVGFQRKGEIWPPAARSAVPLHVRKLGGFGEYASAALWLRKELHGHKVMVSKPRMTSFGLVLLAGVRLKELVLDNDDWELGFKLAKTPAPRQVPNLCATVILECLAAQAPHMVASNSWLGRRFSCPVVPHVRDTSLLDPARTNAHDLRQNLQMDGRLWVGFIGSLKPHKGVEDLIAALSLLQDVGLFLAGVDDQDEFASALLLSARQTLGPQRVRSVGFFDLAQLPRVLSLPDILCIPSRSGTSSWGQIPAKLFDAMAMGKPTIVTAVNDMPDIVEGAGRVIPPGDVQALANAICSLTISAELRASVGEAARARALERYSYSSASGVLERILARVPTFA
jgi:glycosyltransferase involved in cell wall biosynthesis